MDCLCLSMSVVYSWWSLWIPKGSSTSTMFHVSTLYAKGTCVLPFDINESSTAIVHQSMKTNTCMQCNEIQLTNVIFNLLEGSHHTKSVMQRPIQSTNHTFLHQCQESQHEKLMFTPHAISCVEGMLESVLVCFWFVSFEGKTSQRRFVDDARGHNTLWHIVTDFSGGSLSLPRHGHSL